MLIPGPAEKMLLPLGVLLRLLAMFSDHCKEVPKLMCGVNIGLAHAKLAGGDNHLGFGVGNFRARA